MKIIGLSGYAQSGKDTAAQIIAMRLAGLSTDQIKENIGVKMHLPKMVFKFAEKLKHIAGYLVGVDPKAFEDIEFKDAILPEWGMTGREFLQKLGTDAVRNGLHQDAWVISAFSGFTENQIAIFSDCRFVNEADAIRARGGRIIRIKRDGFGPANDHPSETELDDYPWDDVVLNNGSVSDFIDNLVLIIDRYYSL